MTVETNANYISDFNKAYPRNRDLIKEGDDHIRLVKAVLQNTFPGMDKTVLPDADKLNKLHSTFTYEGSTLKINNSIEVGSNKDVDCGGNRIMGVGDPEDETDAVNLRSLQGSLMWPIGSIFMTVDARNPEIILGFGTWEKFAAGRVIIGTGTNTDSENEVMTFVNEKKGGTYSTKLKEEHIPAHKHSLEGGKTKKDGAHFHQFEYLNRQKPSPDTKHNGEIAQGGLRKWSTDTDGAHEHELTGSTAEFGKGEAVPNLQPYIACNIWVRKPDAEKP